MQGARELHKAIYAHDYGARTAAGEPKWAAINAQGLMAELEADGVPPIVGIWADGGRIAIGCSVHHSPFGSFPSSVGCVVPVCCSAASEFFTKYNDWMQENLQSDAALR